MDPEAVLLGLARVGPSGPLCVARFESPDYVRQIMRFDVAHVKCVTSLARKPAHGKGGIMRFSQFDAIETIRREHQQRAFIAKSRERDVYCLVALQAQFSRVAIRDFSPVGAENHGELVQKRHRTFARTRAAASLTTSGMP